MRPIAIITGGTGGIGFSCAKLLSENNFDLIIVHKDRRSKMHEIEKRFDELRSNGTEVVAFNMNVNDDSTIDSVSKFLEGKNKGIVKVFIHAAADANVGNLFGTERVLNNENLVYTFQSMAASFVSWSQFLVQKEFMHSGGRIIGFTSMGSTKVLKEYAAVGIAKAALEASCKYMAIELAPRGITVNLINAGVIDTLALRVFSSHESFISGMKSANPSGRLTVPLDVAKAVLYLISDQASWITGDIIRVDGGEQLV